MLAELTTMQWWCLAWMGAIMFWLLVSRRLGRRIASGLSNPPQPSSWKKPSHHEQKAMRRTGAKSVPAPADEPTAGWCDYFLKIDAYLNHQLDDDDAEEFCEHLQECALCKAEVRERKALKEREEIEAHARRWNPCIAGIFSGETRTGQRKAILGHISGCIYCKQFLDGMLAGRAGKAEVVELEVQKRMQYSGREPGYRL